ncbi:MAG TPA: hypothetical protein HPP83_10260 [Candidatus Hydrogenedentes bacterium]|nr:hypothetical protein [Candidatus Hydrogenedentota bacterium]
MVNEHFDEAEPLVEGLDELPRGVFAPGNLRERVLRRTCATVRARPRRRRAIALAGAALAYVAGLATMHLAVRESEPTVPILAQGTPVAIPSGLEPQPSKPADVELVPADLLIDPKAFAGRVATAPLDERMQLLERAGDRHLIERGDVQAALYYYRQLLDLLPATRQTELNPNDSWLLFSLKQARIKETIPNENAST